MIGTSTVSGPWWTQVGVGMGEAVKVGVIVAVGVIVEVTVGEGVIVIVAVAVGSGLANAPDSHPDNKIESPRIKIIVFFIRFLSD